MEHFYDNNAVKLDGTQMTVYGYKQSQELDIIVTEELQLRMDDG